MISRRHLGMAALAGALLFSGAALAEYPERPITLVVPYTAGGQFDTHARLVAQKLEQNLGQTVIVENKPGAGTRLGAEYVANAKGDGYTILMAGATMLSIAPHTFATLNYDPAKFEPISLLNILPMALFAQPSAMPAKTFAEFVEYARAHPGEVNFGTTGHGVATHLLGELMKSELKIDMVAVNYAGTAPGQQDLLGGHLPIMLDGMLAYKDHLEAKRLNVLGVSTPERLPAFPDVPTFAEQGYPALSVASWAALVAPEGTPVDVIAKLNAATVAAVDSKEVSDRMIADATLPKSSTPEEVRQLMANDSKVWGAVVANIGLKLD